MKSKGKVVIFSTHLMEFAEKMCDSIAMIDKGKIILNGKLSEMKEKYASKNVSLNYQGNISFLNSHPMIESIEDYGNTTGIKLKNENSDQELLKLLMANNISIKKFNVDEISLHEIFVLLAGKEVANV
ncbi:MAG: DUF4162 domain-containing protein [Ignavibacteriales bacterium]|nr:MAG: DUF4162 domain-containing protein [Ignavibacteriales bacterium]